MKKLVSTRLGTDSIQKLIFRVSLPIAVSSTVQALYNIVDGIYVSSLSEDALTATSLFFSVNMIMVALISGMAAGLNALLSYSLGRGERERSSEIILTSLLLTFMIAGGFALLGYFGAEAYYRSFNASQSILHYGVDYMRICTVFYLPAALSCIFERILQATNHSTLSMIAQMSGAVVNIILDPVLIFGKLGLPALGIQGAAIATVIGQTVSALLSILFNLVKNGDFQLHFRSFRFRLSTVLEIYRVGLPVTVMQVIGTLMTFSINKILMHFSSTAVSVFGIYYKVQMFIFMQIFAFGQGALTLIAFNRGARKYSRIRNCVRTTILINVCIALLGTLIFQFFTDELISLFQPARELLVMGRRALRIISLIFPIEAVCVTLSYSFQGLGHGGLSLIHSTVRQLFLRVPCAYLLATFFGLDDVWYAFIIAEVVALVMTVLFYRNLRGKELMQPDAE